MLDQLRTDISRILRRGSSVFVRAADTGDFRNVGEVSEVSSKLTPINAPKATSGETAQIGIAIEATFTAMQTADSDLLGFTSLAQTEADILFTRRTDRSQTLTTAQALAASANGVLLAAVPVSIEGQIGGESSWVKVVAACEVNLPYAEII